MRFSTCSIELLYVFLKKIYTVFFLMKNILLTILLTVLFITSVTNAVFATETNQLITELKVFDNDSIFRYLYLYDNHGNKVLETKYYQQNEAWVRKSQTEWLYDKNTCITQREQIWKNAWITTYSIEYDYVNGVLMTEIHSIYPEGVINPVRKITFQYFHSLLTFKSQFRWQDGNWILIQTENYTYFTPGLTESVSTSVYQSGHILTQYLSTFTYNANATINSQFFMQKTGTTDWVNTELINWYYLKDSNKVLSQRKKKWIADTSNWENTQRVDYKYDENKLVAETYQRWKIMFWVNDTQYNYNYDNKGLLLRTTLSVPKYNQWLSIITITYSDFTDNKAGLMESQFDFWGGNTGERTTSFIPFMFNNEMAIQKGERLQLSYLPVTDTGIPEINSSGLLKLIPVYPNPSVGIFYIDARAYGVQSWTISDLNGCVLKTQVQPANSGVIDITDLPNGIYLLQVRTREAHFIQKLIKE